MTDSAHRFSRSARNLSEQARTETTSLKRTRWSLLEMIPDEVKLGDCTKCEMRTFKDFR